MDADGGNPKQLTNSGSDFRPDSSPDGQWIVYQRGDGASGKPTLWKVSVDGGEPVQLTDVNSSVPAISPDGKLIACRFVDPTDNSKKIAIIPFGGGAAVKTFGITIHRWQRVRWTSDATALTYIDIRGGISNIWRQPLDGGPPSQLTFFKADQIFSYDWSRDGKQLACERGLETTDVVSIGSYK
jgi:Tol biopolymer transport system component